jgi:hypothetical protein
MKANAPPGYKWPGVDAFWLTGITFVLSLALEHYFTKIFYPWFEPYCKVQDDPVIRKRRTTKAIKNLFKEFYYCASTFFGWYVLKDSFILSPALGGSGQFVKIFTDFPYF